MQDDDREKEGQDANGNKEPRSSQTDGESGPREVSGTTPKDFAAMIFDSCKELFEMNSERIGKLQKQNLDYHMFCVLIAVKMQQHAIENMVSVDKNLSMLSQASLDTIGAMLCNSYRVWDNLLVDGPFTEKKDKKAD